MYHHRTLVCNKDVNSVTATSSTAHRCRSLGIAFAAIAVLMLTGPGLFAQPVEGSDGLTDHEWSTIQDEISQGYRGTARYRGVVVVDSTARNAVFGMRSMYRRNQAVMHLWGRTVDWAINHKDHAATRIWLATYSGTIPGDDDGMAAYEYLVDSMGFNPDSIHVAAQSTIDTGDFTGYDVVLQTFWYPPVRNAVNVLDQNVPFVTVSVAQAEMMGIGTGDYFELNLLDSVWIQDTGHEITSPWEPGVLDFQQTLWTDAFYVGGNGVALVTLDAALHYPPVECKIGRTHSVAFGSIATVDVTLASGSYWFDMAGFDLLLAYDTSLLEFVSISQGELLDRCGWEYFQYRVGPEADCGGQPCPNGMINLVGVADLASVSGSPSCYADSTGTLAQIDFQVSPDSANDCTVSQIIFMWYDCGDNTFTSISGDSLYLSKDVGGFFESFPWDTTFPTPWGTPDHCIIDSSTTFRQVSFNAGFVQYECSPPPPDGYGDVNLNGIGNEIADWVLFANYFVYGLDVFNVNIQGQIAATEVNGDGVPLTLQDLVYMYYYIVAYPGEPHNPPDPGDTVFFSQDTVAKTVSLSYPDSLRAVLMVFEGDLEPWGESQMDFDSLYTRVLIGSGNWLWSDSTIFEQDSLFYYTGEGTLVATYAAFDGYTPIPTAIVGFAGDCCLNKGNVDNDPSGELNIADLVYLVDYMFVDGPEPPCVRQADVIEDWSIDVADLVFLVDYMFNGGPAAPACP